MKIAILTSGILPVPAVQGGAAENLIDFYLDYNDRHKLYDITVFSVYHSDVEKHPALKSSVNHYTYINRYSIMGRLKAKIYGYLHKKEYYHYQLEYFFEQAYKKLKKQHFDLIVLENRPGYAIKLRNRLDTPILSHIHTDLVNPNTPQAEAIMKSCDGFICVSNYIKSRILSLGMPTKITVVYNGLDEERFLSQRKSDISRLSLGFDDKDFVVIYTGRLVPKKGVKELLEAIQLLKDEPDIKLLVIGGNNFGDSVSNNTYLNELHEIGRHMNGRVFFTGFVPYDTLPCYLKIADVAVIPSHINEAFGMTCIEACALGLPVVATNDGGIPETLESQHHILIDKNCDMPIQIAKAILTIKDHYSDFSGNYLSQSFSKEAYTQSFFKALEEYDIK